MRILLALCQDLETEVVISYVLLVDVEHWEKDIEEITQYKSRPVAHTSLKSFEEDLMKEQDRLGVQKDGTDVLVRARRPKMNHH